MTIRSEVTTCSEKGEMWPRTDLLDLLGIRHPIIQAPMSTYDGPQLVAAVSNAIRDLHAAELIDTLVADCQDRLPRM